MLPSVVFLGLIAVVSRLVEEKDEGVVGSILATTFLSLTVSSFVVLVVVLLGSNPTITVDSGSNIHTVV
jgi:Na+-driven multidrug efflux pump